MFFCGPCGKKRDWPNSIFKSFGSCEICNKVDECSDVPSSYLPMPKVETAEPYQGKHRKES